MKRQGHGYDEYTYGKYDKYCGPVAGIIIPEIYTASGAIVIKAQKVFKELPLPAFGASTGETGLDRR